MALYCGPHACFDCGSRLVSLCKLVRYRGGARRLKAKTGVRGAARPRRARVLPALREHALPTAARAAHGPLHGLGRLARVAARVSAPRGRTERRGARRLLVREVPLARTARAALRVAAAVRIARNPFDAIESMWHFLATRSHERTSRRREPARWDAHVRGHARSWAAFHDHWLAAGADVVRFEDIVEAGEARDAAVERVVALGLALGAPIPERAAMRPTALARAKRSGRVGAGLAHFSADQRAFVLATCGASMRARSATTIRARRRPSRAARRSRV